MNTIYRTDIDGLRAIAVISVILFHLGYIDNGYLGVDVFFVISGYLITGIIFNEVEENNFSILNFYERRIRRIIPLVLFTSLISFILGLLFMLPDDLENMCQSIFATNFSANNILMQITSTDYWAVKNDYKPLMHTWSLGIEEQFYLFYPILFYFLKGDKKNKILPILIILTILSLLFFFISDDVSSKFYFLQYRFFELSIGGVCAIYFNKNNSLLNLAKSQFILYALLLTLVLLLYFSFINNYEIKAILTTITTASILVLGALHFENNQIYKTVISNKVLTKIGKISFSLYMWHQIVFAFSRYFLIEKITFKYTLVLLPIILLLSILTYYTIENPFRHKKTIPTKSLLIITGLSFLLITGASLYVYAIGGIIKDVPELGITKNNRPQQLNMFNGNNNINSKYNDDVKNFEVPFTEINNIKVLVIGDSFARDFSNILLESSLKERIELCYISDPLLNNDTQKSLNRADYIFYASFPAPTKKRIHMQFKHLNLNSNKLWIVGTKDFGNSNGIFYNKKSKENHCQEYRTFMKKGVFNINIELKKEWGNRYIDLIGPIIDSEKKVFVFTPECKFISQDTRHLTKYGARFFSNILEVKLKKIIKTKRTSPL